MKALIIKYSNYADNGLGLHTKKLVGSSFGEMMAELAAWAMQPAYVVDNSPEHRVYSLGWQGEGQIEVDSTNSSSFVQTVKQLLMAEAEVDKATLRKAAKYDDLSETNRLKGQKSAASLTPEQRRERAKKAVAARIAKYHQGEKE